jgi:hypothetical protein
MKNSTHINVLLDRSGSMSSIREKTVSGLNHFIAEQKRVGDNATLTLAQFDLHDGCDITYTHENKPIADVTPITLDQYEPRGTTPLLEATVKTIDATGRVLSVIPEADRPDKVVFVIITDGQENASQREYSRDRVKRLIEQQERSYNWKFMYLGANVDAFAEAQALGISMAQAAAYSPSPQGMHNMMDVQASKLKAYRQSGREQDLAYNIAEREKMMAEGEDDDRPVT